MSNITEMKYRWLIEELVSTLGAEYETPARYSIRLDSKVEEEDSYHIVMDFPWNYTSVVILTIGEGDYMVFNEASQTRLLEIVARHYIDTQAEYKWPNDNNPRLRLYEVRELVRRLDSYHDHAHKMLVDVPEGW